MRQAVEALARIGFRRAQRQVRAGAWTGRARIGRPSSQRSKIFGQSARRLIARLRIALQTARTDGFEVTIECRRNRTELGRRIRCGLPEDGKNIRADERWTIGEEVEKNCSQTIDVGCGREFPGGALCLLRGDIARRAEGGQGFRQVTFGGRAIWRARNRSRTDSPWPSSRMFPGLEIAMQEPWLCA